MPDTAFDGVAAPARSGKYRLALSGFLGLCAWELGVSAAHKYGFIDWVLSKESVSLLGRALMLAFEYSNVIVLAGCGFILWRIQKGVRENESRWRTALDESNARAMRRRDLGPLQDLLSQIADCLDHMRAISRQSGKHISAAVWLNQAAQAWESAHRLLHSEHVPSDALALGKFAADRMIQHHLNTTVRKTEQEPRLWMPGKDDDPTYSELETTTAYLHGYIAALVSVRERLIERWPDLQGAPRI